MKKIDTTVQLFDLFIFSNSKKRLLDLIKSDVSKKYGMLTVATPNPEQVVQAHSNPSFKEQLQQFDLLLPDGQGLLWASNILMPKNSIKERIAGREVVADLLSFAADNNKTVLIIGGREYDSYSLKSKLLSTSRQLTIVSAKESLRKGKASTQKRNRANSIYWLPAYQDISKPLVKEELAVKQVLEVLKPNYVFVALGAPSQEVWIQQHKDLLKSNGVELAMVVGGSFDYLTGKVPQVPTFIEQLRLEWLFRLVFQPWRWKRQLRLPIFVAMVLKEKLS